jgi:hypothetical protein
MRIREAILQARGWIVGDECRLARRWQSKTAREVAELRRFARRMRCESAAARVLLARAADAAERWFWAGLPTEELLSMHWWTTGSTGSGKTFLVLGVLLQLLEERKAPVVILDMKGELATLLTETVLPALSQRADDGEFLQNLRIVRPFDSSYVPQLRLTAPEPGVAPEIQAYNLAAALEEALGADLGARMHHVFLRLALLAVELNQPLPVIGDWLTSPARFADAAGRSGDGALREYARSAFPRENRASLEALRARLDSFLFLPQVRAALAAKECLSFGSALEQGVTIIDLGDPPAGAERVARFWAGVLIGRLSRAILSREVSGESPRALIVLEEFQEALQRFQAEQFARLLALARHKRVSLLFVNQQPGQLEPQLTRLLRTNTGLECAFRCNYEDAQSLAHAFPVPADTKRPAEARQALARQMTGLPQRSFYLWLKEASFRAQLVRSPRLDLDELRSEASRTSEEIRERIRQGVVADRVVDALPASDKLGARDLQAFEQESLMRPTEALTDEQFPSLG